MDRLVALGFWLVVIVIALGSLPWVLAQLPTGWIPVLCVAIGAGLLGQRLRRRDG